LYASIVAEPVEDGVTHPGEDILREILNRWASASIDDLARLVFDAPDHSVSASVLRLAGRIHEFPEGTVRKNLISRALQSPDIELRDAAIQTAGSWEDQELLPILKNHREEIFWLRDYLQDVISDLEE